MSLYMTRQELQELTGYTMRSSVIGWLDRQSWPYVVGRVDGWPRVLRQYHDQRLLGMTVGTAKKRAEPNWTKS
jgi:hypothetical protein